ncbi:MAG TPA: protein kinase, partial [Anaerolineaceae bacterium]|nr:protein kinase [Anaerolineaceae bacterium]
IYLHGQTPAIIHRDIKPQNIIVDEQGKITLIDFGISRIYDETAQEDTYNFGTRHYAAPEQYGFSQTDCRSDIYSLGVLLCWLLTGSTDVQQANKAIPNPWLVNVIARCTAFAPKDRFKNAAQVRDTLTGRTYRRRLLTFGLAVLILLAAAIFVAKNSATLLPARAAGVTFKEPLIEQAVRLALDKDATEEISEQDLLSITELFVFGNQAAASEEIFYGVVNEFVNNTGTVSRGSISVLDDLTKLKNLNKVSLCYQNIVDLTPLAELAYLESIDLRHNPIEDLAPLSQLLSLESLCLFDTHVTDLSVLRTCPRLSMVDVGFSPIRSTTAFAGLTSLRTLVIRKAPLQSLEQVDELPMLEQIYLSETQLTDLSPLLALPRLNLVEVDESMRKAAEAVAESAQFSIVYQ